MKYYINSLKHSGSAQRDIKELIPEMNMRCRMSRVVKMGVSTAIESLMEFDAHGEVDAIVTATGLGCIADSEKFLSNLLCANEQMLNPTPFIQSTFNTVGAQVALIRSMNCYNNTFTHRYISFESALLDAMLTLNSARAKAVLVGVFDESTPTLEIILKRLGALKSRSLGEGAIFFVLTGDRMKCSLAEVELSWGATNIDDALLLSQASETLWSGAVAQMVATMVEKGQQGVVVNDMGGEINSTITIKSI